MFTTSDNSRADRVENVLLILARVTNTKTAFQHVVLTCTDEGKKLPNSTMCITMDTQSKQ